MAKHNAETNLVPAALVLLGVVGVGGFIAYTMSTEDAAAAALANQSVDLERPTKDITLQQQGELVAPAAWADKTKGTATVPIDRAMQIVVKQLQDNPAAASPPTPAPKEPDADAGAEGDAAAAADDGGAAATDGGEATAADGGAAADAEAPKEQPKAPTPPKAPTQPKPELPTE